MEFHAIETKKYVTMILNGHILDYNDLKSRNDDESILINRSNYIAGQYLIDEEDIDSNNIAYYTKKQLYFRSGTAEIGMLRR